MTADPHWSRWGDPAKEAPLPDATLALVRAAFGELTPIPQMPLERLRPPESSLSYNDLVGMRARVGTSHVLTGGEVRARHTGGGSTPDLIARRTGALADAPDAVITPADHDEVAALLGWCAEQGIAVVPFGGGTSVVGGLAPARDRHRAVIALDLRRLDRLLAVDEESMTARLEPGLRGPDAEALLAAHGMTLGHFPQSFEYASIGGFAATRSSGQSSAGYGRFDQLVTALRVATPVGDWRLGHGPMNAAGPDLRQLVLGSEGAFGVITEVTVRTRPVPETRHDAGFRMPSFAAGADALRELARSDVPCTVLRLSDEAETAIGLATPDAVGAAGPDPGALLIACVEGDEDRVTAGAQGIAAIAARHGGEPLGRPAGERWRSGRFDGPYLRDGLLDAGVLVDTLETVTEWSKLGALHAAVGDAVRAAAASPAVVLCHISHIYETGASLYFTVAAKAEADPTAQWRAIKRAASEAIVAAGASITHHHAIGRDHLPWLEAEIGTIGIAVLRAVKRELDPHGILNPGILIP